jgi:hypothetical protein
MDEGALSMLLMQLEPAEIANWTSEAEEKWPSVFRKVQVRLRKMRGEDARQQIADGGGRLFLIDHLSFGRSYGVALHLVHPTRLWARSKALHRLSARPFSGTLPTERASCLS